MSHEKMEIRSPLFVNNNDASALFIKLKVSRRVIMQVLADGTAFLFGLDLFPHLIKRFTKRVNTT